MLNFIKKNYFIVFVIFSGIPIFFIPTVWDALIFDYGFSTNNLSGTEIFFKNIGSPFQLFFIYLIFFIKKITLIPHEILFDLLTVITLILFSFEIKKYSEIIFKLNNNWSNLCAIFAISFPVWHSLVAFNLGLYLVCFYFVLLGYRLFISESLPIKIIGIIIILFSFSIKSNFSFIIGLCFAHNFRLFLNKETIKIYSLLFIIFLSVSSYAIDIKYFPPYGLFDGYNQVKFENFDFLKAIKNTYDYLTFFIYYLWIPFFYFIFLKIKSKKVKLTKIFEENILKDYLTIIIIFASSIIPYVLLNKSVDLFFFGDYVSRHAYLVAVSFGLFFTILFKKISEIFSIKKIHLLFVTLFILQNLIILSSSFYTKIESAFFRYDFVQKLKKIDQPPGGNVQIINNHSPDNLRNIEVNYLFYKAYGKASWWASIHKNQQIDENFSVPEHKLKDKGYKTYFILDDYEQRCNTVMQLTNEISKFERILKFYIFNFEDYFKIKILKVSC